MTLADWSQRVLEEAALAAPIAINDILFAQLLGGFSRIEACEALLVTLGVTSLPIPRGALFLAGKVFRDHCRRGGARSSVRSGFVIGAHAAHDGLPLLTRDPRHYRANFPTRAVLAPDTHP